MLIGSNIPSSGHSPCNPDRNEQDIVQAIDDIHTLIEEIENNPILDEATKEDLIKYYERCLRKVTLALVNILIEDNREDEAIIILLNDSRFDMQIKGYSLLISTNRILDADLYLNNLVPRSEEEIDFVYSQRIYLNVLQNESYFPSENELDQLYSNGHKNTVLAGFTRSVYLYFTNELIMMPIEMEGYDIIDPRNVNKDQAEITVYPNPFQGSELSIKSSYEFKTKVPYSIYSIQGEKISDGIIESGVNKLTIDENISSGIYFLRFLLPSGDVDIHKIIKN